MPLSLTENFISQQKISLSFQTRVLVGTLELRLKILSYCCGLGQEIAHLLCYTSLEQTVLTIHKILARE